MLPSLTLHSGIPPNGIPSELYIVALKSRLWSAGKVTGPGGRIVIESVFAGPEQVRPEAFSF